MLGPASPPLTARFSVRATPLLASLRRAEALAVGGIGIAAAVLFARLIGYDTDYDEGVYLSSVDALRHGQALGEDVFAPQPPGWYALLQMAAAVPGGDSVTGMQTAMVVVAVGSVLAVYALGRALAGPAAGLLAGATLVVAPPFPLYAHRVLADIPAAGAAAAALALAASAGRRRDPRLAAAAGAVLAAAVSIKLTALLALLPFAALLLWHERAPRLLTATGGAVAAVALVIAAVHAPALDELWSDVVVYHADARATAPVLDNSETLRSFLHPRTPFAWLVLTGLVAAAALLSRRRALALSALWAWSALAVVFVLAHNPLHENHLVLLPVVLAVTAGATIGAVYARLPFRARVPAAALLVLALAAGYAQQHRHVVGDQIHEEAEIVWAADQVRRATRSTDLVVSDHSIVPYLADRRTPGPLVDTAVLRFANGSLSPEDVLRTLDEHRVAAVVAGRAFTEQPEVVAGIRVRYTTLATLRGVTVYVRRG